MRKTLFAHHPCPWPLNFTSPDPWPLSLAPRHESAHDHERTVAFPLCRSCRCMLCCSRLKRDSTSITYSSLMMSVLTDSSNCSAWNAASIRLLCAASPCMPPAGWPALAGGAAGGDSAGGCGWAAVRAEVVACCSARLLCAASPCMPPAGWPALAGGAAGGDSAGGCGWAAVRAEVVACCSARWRSLSCSKSPTDDGGGGAVCAGCKLWPSAVSLGECNVSKSGPRACCASACLAKRRECEAR